MTATSVVHEPNTPRTHDADGHKLDEPLQCRACLETWPCETRQLITVVTDLRARMARARAWIQNCVRVEDVGLHRKQAMLDELADSGDRP